ncbi:uncharacterized protein LODBEIA_P20050 [Lodderomyces beijingensis]|uniref:DNA damage-binding protein CMR1 n=1 Tax=Lodderomyces beijingensis TaxID=1775926 RepID=A0ABP0ZI10_9ASCO
MSEERQRILEQKRQRLQELKSRRLASSHLTEASSSVPGKKVDAATQTDSSFHGVQDLAPASASHASSTTVDTKEADDGVSTVQDTELELYKFDKGVQTDEPVEVLERLESKPVEKNGPVVITSSSEIPVFELDQAILESIKVVNKLQVSRTVELGSKKEESKTNLQFISNTKTLVFDRDVETFDISQHDPHKIVVGFKRSYNYQHTATLFEIRDDKPLACQHLICFSEITHLMFDVHRENRVIGTMRNAAIAIWEIDESAIVQEPTLLTHTSIFASTSSTTSWFQHQHDIAMIEQISVDTNDCLLVVSGDGVLNLWSTNLLSTPKYSTRLIPEDQLSKLMIESGIYVGNRDIVGKLEDNLKNQMVLTATDGKLYDEKMQPLVDTNEGILVLAMAKLDKDLIVTSHLDWHLRVWRVGGESKTRELWKAVPTGYVVEKIVKRPQHRFQFLTIGKFGKKISVDLWDLSRKLFKPIINIAENLQDIKHLEFNGPMEILMCERNEIKVFELNQDYNIVLDEDDLDRGLG